MAITDSNLEASFAAVQYQFSTVDNGTIEVTLAFPEEATDTTYWDSLAYTIADAINDVESWGGLESTISKNFGGSDISSGVGGNNFSDPGLTYPAP